MRIAIADKRSDAHTLARFFHRNLSSEYISHSELQGRRAIGPYEWVPDIENVLCSEKGDDAAQYSMILWATMWIIVVSITIFLFWVGEKGETLKLGTLDDASFAQYVNTFAQIAGILVAATMIVVTNRRNARQADEASRTQIYQALELESIALFRFESGNTAVARVVWESDGMPSGHGARN
jgi:hypothetical protein